MSEVTKETKEEMSVIKTESGKVVQVAELLGQVADMEEGMDLTADYLKFVDGEPTRVVFLEMTKMNGMGEKSNEMVDAVSLLGMDGRYKINADTKLVSACKRLAEKGRTLVPLQVISKGEVKGTNGKYKDLLIQELNPKK